MKMGLLGLRGKIIGLVMKDLNFFFGFLFILILYFIFVISYYVYKVVIVVVHIEFLLRC